MVHRMDSCVSNILVFNWCRIPLASLSYENMSGRDGSFGLIVTIDGEECVIFNYFTSDTSIAFSSSSGMERSNSEEKKESFDSRKCRPSSARRSRLKVRDFPFRIDGYSAVETKKREKERKRNIPLNWTNLDPQP